MVLGPTPHLPLPPPTTYVEPPKAPNERYLLNDDIIFEDMRSC